MFIGVFICASIFLSTLVGGKAWSQTSDRASMIERIDTARTTTNKIRARKCRPQFRFRYVPVTTYPGARLQAGLNTWRTRLRAARAARTRCRSAEAVIRHVFGPTASAAMRVAECESHLYPRALNPSSGAAGLFQLMPFHWRGKFDPFNARANTEYAYRLSQGGHVWSAWVCKP